MANNPSQIGKYKIISQIGKGGMGAVYKAVHPTLNKTVIIKKLTLTGSKDFIERFRREAKLMMEFRNENIVQVHDHFKEGNAYHIVMEYVDGITLEELIESKRFLSEQVALLIFTEICKALKYAHDRNVIHRDIKPANILISKTGVVKLVDFGVSTSLDASDEDGLTKAGMTIGTPSYLAPEQIANAKNRDKRADIYSMGVMLYEMVIGKKPFRGGFSPEVIALIEKGKYLPPRKINPKIKSATESIIKKAMHHKVSRRFQDLGIVIKKVSRFLKIYKTQDQVNTSIKAYLEGKEDPFQKKKSLLKKLAGKLAIVTSVLVLISGGLALGGFWAFQQGLHYEWLYPDQFGALQVMVKLRKGSKEVEDLFVKALIFREKNNSLSQVREAKFKFKEVKELESKTSFTVMSRKIYLPKDMYKLIVYAENEQFRENFFLYPREVQASKANTGEALQVSFNLDQAQPSLPVDVTVSVNAIHTGQSLNHQSEISVHNGQRWMAWFDFISGVEGGKGFLSGQRYRIRFKHPDYFTKYYNLTIFPEQTKVSTKVNLVPLPGDLNIKSEVTNVKVLLNNSDEYIDGSSQRSMKSIPDIGSSTQKLVLSPGDYALTAKSTSLLFGAKPVTKTISIRQKEETVVVVKQVSDSLQLDIK